MLTRMSKCESEICGLKDKARSHVNIELKHDVYSAGSMESISYFVV